MKHWISYFLRLGLLLGIAVTLAACGGGGGGGATPSSTGGGSPVTVEIPALGEVSGLPFASGLVVTGSGNIAVALKATPSSWVAKSFTLTNGSAFVSGDSRAACEYRNAVVNSMSTWPLPDQALCTIKQQVSAITTPYDGNYHILSLGSAIPGIASKIKFKMVRNSSNLITTYEAFTCDSTNTQLSYTNYTISGSALTASLKTINSEQPQRKAIDLTGTINAANSAQFTAKSGNITYTGVNGAGAYQGAISLTQAPTTLLVDGFDTRSVRLIGQADQSNSSSPFAISGYTFGAGAATFIEIGTTTTATWNSSNKDTTNSGSNFDAINGKTPKATSTVSVDSFSGSTAWDCSGTAEATATFSSGASSCYTLFSLSAAYIDCATTTQGYLTVTPSVSSTTLSTNSASPTSVSATPTILLTASRALDTSSTNSTTVALVNNSTSDAVTLTYTNFNSVSTTLTLSPTLTSGQTYKLTLVGSATTATSGTVIRAPGSEAPADQLQSTTSYYITAQ